MLKIGLIGLANAGKSTLYNVLTGAGALTAPYPFSTVEPNKSNLKLADKGAFALSVAIGVGDIQFPIVEVWDIAGLIKGAHNGDGLGNEFLGYIKDCDFLIHVVRRREMNTDQLLEDIQVVENEIAFFDHSLLVKPYEKARRMTKLYPRNTAYKSLDLVLSKAFSETKNGASVNQVLDIEEIEIIKEYSIVSSTPSIYLVNLDSSFKPVTDMPVKLRDALQTNILDIFSAQDLTDEDLTLLGLNGADTKDFIYEITESIISKGNLKCFYTVGHLGVGFWVIDTKSDAKSCAQLVHDEISETLKSVNVASLDSFITFKNWKELSKRGLVKTYSPSYVPKDKEVLFFNI